MNIEGRKIWQVSAGDTNRNYVDICLDWDVILNGPGYEGPWPECESVLRDKWNESSRKLTDLKRFYELQEKDLVVLRLGTKEIFGVGRIKGGYDWSPLFADIDGWELQHYRRVKWFWDYRKHSESGRKQFETYSLKFGDTVQFLDSNEVKNWIAEISLDVDENSLENVKDLPKFPTENNEVNLEAVSEFLFNRGVASTSIQTLLGEIGELSRIAKWYKNEGGNPSESETVSYLVVPLLRALGWTPQKMAIEWNYVDLALFKTLPRKEENLSVVVEAKAKGLSCLTAKSQAQSYTDDPKYPDRKNCKRLIVTDGLRYGVFIKEGIEFKEYPDAYLNLTLMQERYPILGDSLNGAKEAFLLMAPDWEVENWKLYLLESGAPTKKSKIPNTNGMDLRKQTM
ncbi:MAG: hypothetical protein O2999_13535 [Nitrospirae bacterium]|nr:hypothetical protein [Nitrospirota bacterium]